MTNSVGSGFPSTQLQFGHVFCDIDDKTLWKYIGGPPTLSSSWILIGGSVATQPDTTLWGIAQAGAMWFNSSFSEYYGWDGVQIVPLALGQAINNYNFRRTFTLQEDFLGGSQSTGFIGVLGWNGAGTLTVQAGLRERPGIFRIDTGAVSGTQARLNLISSTNFNRGVSHAVTWVVRPNNIDANTTIRVGVANGVSANPPNDGMYFEKLDADTTWFCVVRVASSGPARIDTGIPVAVTFNDMKYTYDGSVVRFYINNNLVASETIALPNSLVCPFMFIINSAAAAKTMDVDYFEMASAVTR